MDATSEPDAPSVIRLVRCLAADGAVVGDLPEFARDPAGLTDLFRAMTLTRTFDRKAVELQRSGRLGTYASSFGQEAVAVGVAAAMTAEDVLLPSFREHGAQLWRGVTPLELFLFWGGDERGSDFAGPREDFPVSIPIASHAPHAAGVALALKRKGGGRAAVCILGDGASSKGDFYEAMNVAGVWALPLVFVVVNNGWAISMPRARQTAARTLAQKAWAAGFLGLQVDGNDVIAVRHVMEEALAKARAGGGPTLVEALTYRLADHTTADDAGRYRQKGEVEGQLAAEPLGRLRRYLSSLGAWSKAEEEALKADCQQQIEAAAEAYLATPPEPPEAMVDYLFATLPADLAAERARLAGGAGG
jgi:2-oxoisovalerate dehydrogenase E1 component alpha subunit